MNPESAGQAERRSVPLGSTELDVAAIERAVEAATGKRTVHQ
ncbi:hypothetical protein ACIBP6_15500 [Nonomuraea terrae]